MNASTLIIKLSHYLIIKTKKHTYLFTFYASSLYPTTFFLEVEIKRISFNSYFKMFTDAKNKTKK